MANARTAPWSGIALLASLLVACSPGPSQPTSGNPPNAPFQTQQLTGVPPFGTVSPEDYQAARASACRRYCARYSRYGSRYAWISCMRSCMTGAPTDMFPNR